MMLDQQTVITRLTDCGVIAVVRATDEDKARKIALACAEAGIVGVEITFTVPNAVQVIERLSQQFTESQMIIGAGTVLDSQTARAAILAGAKYIVSPYLDIGTVRLCNSYGIACMPGAMTLKEAADGLRAGAQVIKLFPGELYGPKIIKAFRGPMPQLKMIPTGGVCLENIADWISAGAVAVGVGGSLTAAADQGDYAAVVRTGKQMIEQVKLSRGATV